MTYASPNVIHCDTCPENIEVDDATDFNETLAAAKSKGWRSYQGPDKQWAHACPVCVADFAAERSRP